MCRCFFPAVNCGSDGPNFQIMDRRARLEVRKTVSCPRIISLFLLAISTHFQTGLSSAHHFLFSFMVCLLLIPILSCCLCSAKLCLLPYHFFEHFVLYGAFLEAPQWQDDTINTFLHFRSLDPALTVFLRSRSSRM